MISAIILAKNEEKNIGQCIDSVGFCDEILVIDDYSTDNTEKSAKKHGAKVLKHKLDQDFASQRNWGIIQATNEWILFIDADEKISSSGAKEILNTISSTKTKVGFYLPRYDVMWNKTLKYGDIYNTKLLRLAKKNCGNWEGCVHEQWKIFGEVGDLKNHIIHAPHQTLTEFLEHLNSYSTIKSQYFINSNRKISLAHIWFSPIWKFVKNYLLRLGFLDGTAGFIHALLMSFYVFQVASKTYLAKKN